MSSTHMACRVCGNGEFWLLPGGEIICADDDCHARYGRWVVELTPNPLERVSRFDDGYTVVIQ